MPALTGADATEPWLVVLLLLLVCWVGAQLSDWALLLSTLALIPHTVTAAFPALIGAVTTDPCGGFWLLVLVLLDWVVGAVVLDCVE